MFEFPSSRNNWRLDIVSILAVLGESNIKIHAQSITASRFCLLPRLLPAPQALLQESRPSRLPYMEDVTVYAPQTGFKRDGLNFVPNLIHRVESLPPYTLQVVDIGWNMDNKHTTVSYRTFAPLNQLAIASSLLSIGLMVWAAWLDDGVAFIGVLLISFASSAIGYGSSWIPSLINGRRARSSPRRVEEVVLQARWGAYIVVRCDPAVARALYWQPEECLYFSSSRAARLLGGVLGGLMVLVAVVLFANCTSWVMQAAIGTSYAILNVVYWLFTVIPKAWSWDLRCYAISNQVTEYHETYTRVVWSAIKASRSVSWVRDHDVLPKAEIWRDWLDQAEEHLDDEDWDPEGALDEAIGRVGRE